MILLNPKSMQTLLLSRYVLYIRFISSCTKHYIAFGIYVYLLCISKHDTQWKPYLREFSKHVKTRAII